VTVGRLPECTISINDSNISRTHAEVKAGATGYVVNDLGSTNGTMVNGVKILGEQRLRDGDIISFGSTHVRFEAS
jgi:pSer/pThr/pTyr-binding forkhead associated (FHA) protein